MSEENKLVWTASFYKPKLEKVMSNTLALSGEYLYYIASVADTLAVCRHDLKTGENRCLHPAGGPGGLYLSGAPDGLLYVGELSHRDAETFSVTMLKIWDGSDGVPAEKLATFEMPIRVINCMQPFVADGDGNFYYSYADGISVRDKNGAPLFELDTKDSMYNNLLRLPDGRVAVEKMQLSKTPPSVTYQLFPINLAARALDEPILIGQHKGRISTGFGKYLFFYIDLGDNLVGYNTALGGTETLFNCRELDINLHQAEALHVSEDGTVRIVNITGGVDGIVHEIATVTKKPAVLDRRITLEYAAYSLNQWARERIAEFNRTDPDYRIRVTEYAVSDSYPRNDIAAAVRRLTDAVLSDTPPDIMDLSFAPKAYLAARGLLADLYPLIDSDGVLSRGSFMEAPLKALETDGRLYWITPGFMLSAFVGKQRVVGDMPGLTYGGLTALMDAHPGAALAHDWSDITALTMLLEQCLNDFVDWKTLRCRFDDGAFQKLLELAGRHPAQPAGMPLGGVSRKTLYQAAHDGDILMENILVQNFWHLQLYRDIFGEEPAYKAYPGRSGRGHVKMVDSAMYAVSSRTKHPDAAWRVLREFLTGNMSPIGFPVLKNDFAERATEEMTENYVDQVENVPWEVTLDREGRQGFKLDEDGRIIRFKHGQGRGNVKMPASQQEIIDDNVWIYAVSAEEYDRTLALINEVSGVSEYNPAILNIVTEFAGRYFTGEMTAEEACDKIQAEVSDYLRTFES
jgi:ABC-type glycerol-3-phosphate transport system substrate-binding protein